MEDKNQELTDVMEQANQESIIRNLSHINVDMFILGLCKVDCDAKKILADLDASPDFLVATIEENYKTQEEFMDLLPSDRLNPDTDLHRIQKSAVMEHNQLGLKDQFSSKYWLLALMLETNLPQQKFLVSVGLTYQKVLSKIKTPDQPSVNKTKKNTNKVKILELYGVNLNEMAKNGKLKPVIGRNTEIGRVIEILSRKEKNNPMLVGEPGVGKTAIAEGLALKIVNKDISPDFLDKIVYTLNINSVVAGTKYRGQFEERMQAIIKAVNENPNIILFVDEIHTIIGSGGAEGGLDVGNILKPALARGDFRCIGATTLKEYKRIEKDGALARRFKKVMTNEPTKEETIKILEQIEFCYSDFHKVTYNKDIIDACVNLSSRYIPNGVNPDKSLDLLDDSGAIVKLQTIKVPPELDVIEDKINKIQSEIDIKVEEQDFEACETLKNARLLLEEKRDSILKEFKTNLETNKPVVSLLDVQKAVSVTTDIPLNEITKSDAERLLTLDKELNKVVIGQENAINQLCNALKRNSIGIKSENSPIGKFIFLGPSGVGKTFIAKQLGEKMMGTKDSIIRLDMSEYMEKHSVSKIIGSPPGYVGYEEGGQLTEKVKNRPYSVILLDEIEKAHPDVMNIFLQVLEDGFLTDSLGMKVYFKNTIIIMTSNAGTSFNKSKIGFAPGEDNYSDAIKTEFEKRFSKEFRGRFDDIIIFNQLTQDNMLEILNLCVLELEDRLKTLNLKLNIDLESKKYLLTLDFNKDFGARDLKKIITNNLENLITDYILTSKPKDTINISLNSNKLFIN